MTSAFSTRSTGRRAQQGCKLLRSHGRRPPVQDNRHRRGSGKRQRPVLFRDSGQTGQSLIGVVDGLVARQLPEVVVQPALLYTHHGPFALDYHGIYRDLTFSQHYIPQIRAVGLYLAKLVGEVLYLQSVRAQCGTYLEAPSRLEATAST